MVFLVCLAALVALAAANNFGQNIAQNRPTGSSSVFVNGVPPLTASSNLAVDGNFNSNFFSGSCFSSDVSANDPNPFWYVDLGSRVYVSGVTITNRGDCCADRLSGLRVEVFEFNPTTSAETPELCATLSGGVALGQSIGLACSPLTTGRFLRISKPGATSPLTLCEVVVSGGKFYIVFHLKILNFQILVNVPPRPPVSVGAIVSIPKYSPTTNIAQNRPVRATSQFNFAATNLIASPGLAVDGNFNTDFVNGRSCYSSAIGDLTPTLYIDLGAYYYINSIIITNRGDCCAERLRNINVSTLLKDPFRYLEFPKQCGTITGNVAAGADATVNCNQPTVARYIKIQKTSMVDSNDLLTLCEVQVTGRFASYVELTKKPVDNDVAQALAANGVFPNKGNVAILPNANQITPGRGF
ncbi:uncharacterized protein LOC124270223 [Haliotis rubra]|uniref:uncharacterized protein LOC124270223 n=1 Tax=Haliotis rubra TaxID=36100 RepID=UPI001EE5372D|nr:uncharacterized protein LOC124270223 [Haliotis rubra]